jgi:phosphinothricin acetyltransferase
MSPILDRTMISLPAASIRASTEADMAEVAAIYGHYVENSTVTFEEEVPSVAEIGSRRRALLRGNYPYWVAVSQNSVVGYAYAGPYRPRSAYRHTVENSVYLRPASVGKGIGRRLLTTLIESCESLGFRQMVAVIGGRDNTASVGLHQRCGFGMVGSLEAVGFKQGQWLPTLLMQRALGTEGLGGPARCGLS